MLLFYIVPVQLPFFLKKLGIEKNSLAGFVVSTLTRAIVSFNDRRIKAQLSYIIYLGISFSITGVARVYCCINRNGFLLPNPSLWLMSLAFAEIRRRLIGALTR